MSVFLNELAARGLFGVKPGLERIGAVLAALGNPQNNLAVIHIAGSNGKGSVAAICENALRISGYKVGRYTSPHLLRVNERITLDGQLISDAELDACSDLITVIPEAAELTYFEFLTAAAFLSFRRAEIKLVVLETGLGGRFDATNVVMPLVSVITTISLEHCAVLGGTLAKIAGEKAGIIKEGRPVVIGALPDEARAVIGAEAKAKGAPVLAAAEIASVRMTKQTLYGQTVKVSLPDRDFPPTITRLNGAYQLENIAVALTALDTVSKLGVAIPDTAFTESLRTVVWPARYQLIEEEPPVILDSAHNPDGMRTLCATIRKTKFLGPVGLVIGTCADKDIAGSVAQITPAINRAWCVPVPSPRSVSPEQLSRAFSIQSQPVDSVETALELARTWAEINNGLIVVAGSIFLAGQILELTGSYPYGDTSRKDSNETVSCTK